MPATVAVIVCLSLFYNSKAAVIDRAEDDCPRRCICEDILVSCDGFIPTHVPEHTTTAVLTEIQTFLITEGAFSHPSWSHVISLTISCSTCSDQLPLNDYVFLGLDNLEILRIHSKGLSEFSSNTFSGILNVLVLDLSRCIHICTQDLIIALSDINNLSKMSHLILDTTAVTCEPYYFEMNQTVIDILAQRNITTINLSSTKVYVDYIDITPLCDTLESLNFSNSDIQQSHKLVKSKNCPSLHTLDLSGVSISKSVLIPKLINLTNMNLMLGNDNFPPLVRHLSTVYSNHLLSKEYEIILLNTTVSISFENSLSELHFCGYNIVSLDINLDVRHNHLKYLDLSNNNICNIGPNIFQQLPFLTRIDLAHNNVSLSNMFSKTFSKLFSKNVFLEEVNLANNDLSSLPVDIFRNNTLLKRINLSENKFEQITFDTEHLLSINMLDLRHNSIRKLNVFSRNSLDKLYNRTQSQNTHKTNHNKTLQIRLWDNPFSCSCQSLSFLKWFVRSPIFSSTRHLYHCRVNGQWFPMNKRAVTAAKEECEKPIKRRTTVLLSTAIPSCTLIFLLIGINVSVKYRKKISLQRRLEDRVKLLQSDNIGFKYLLFISFTSDDDRFVKPNILLPLTRYLRIMTGIKRDLICVGDLHFRPGRTILSEMIRCLEESAVFIAVMSRSYCASDCCKLEIEQARLQRKPIILIFIEKVDEGDMNVVMRDVFRNNVRVKFVLEDGEYRIQPDWQHVYACYEPRKIGSCKARILRYYFNQVTGRCEKFYWGGCEPNGNNFQTYFDCLLSCIRRPTNICNKPRKVGPCRARKPRYFFNKKTRKCQKFRWGGCRPNGNNFKTKSACRSACIRH